MTKKRRVALRPLYSFTFSVLLCSFGKQDDALVGWPDAISADPLMNFEPNETSFSVEFG